jgi:hypothetical protein
MSHDTHVTDGKHLELDRLGRQWFLDVTKDWVDPYGPPIVEKHDGIMVVRDDLIVGSKCRFADLLMASIKEDTVVYVQPRVGLAGVSILEAAKKYNKKVVLFMPSSKEISQHQACCIERGAIPKFRRIAAMPNLNIMAKKWAEENNAKFIPLGLKHELVVACAARVAINIAEVYGQPDVCFVATSTGVLVRGLQIGWRETEFYSICVSRNMHEGELGKAIPISEPKEFQQLESIENRPPYPSVHTYDSKTWKYAVDYKNKNPLKSVLVWNVGKDPELINLKLPKAVNSYRNWNQLLPEDL